MNDPGLDEPIQNTAFNVVHTLQDRLPDETSSRRRSDASSRRRASGPREAIRNEIQDDEDEEEVGYFQPKRWWFTSTAFPLIAGTFGPLANLFSVCALVQTWRVRIPDGESEEHPQQISDPHWLLAINSVSLALALTANIFLLFNFTHRVRYSIAQPLTITLWYLSAILLLVPLSLTHKLIIQPRTSYVFSQSYYYGIISTALYGIISTLLLFNLVGAHVFHAYPPSFNSLTIPQRTLMLQTISYVLYLAVGAGMFAALEDWSYVDGVYFSNYTLLTIGLGTDFPLLSAAGQALMIPYAVGGITMIGLVIGSVRGLVLERGEVKVKRRTLEKERNKWIEKEELGGGADLNQWKEREFRMMREVEDRAEKIRKYGSLSVSFLAYLIVWLGGAVVFWFSEAPQSWTYFQSVYFAYTSLLTIGYGDYYPQSNSGKPFFVVWSLIAVPTVTILISNMGSTVVGWLKEGVLWLGQRTLLAEPVSQYGTKKKYGMKGVKSVKRRIWKEEERERKTEANAAEGDREERLGQDVERLGGAMEMAEDESGRREGLTARIAREIQKVARDVGSKPPKRYEWDDWTKWLGLLGENSKGRNSQDPAGSKESKDGKEDKEREEDVEWSWLGEDGPLCGGMSETEWILEKLCAKLEEALKDELGSRQSEGSSDGEVGIAT